VVHECRRSVKYNSILDFRALRIEELMALRAFSQGAVFGEVAGTPPVPIVALHGWGRRGRDFAKALAGLDHVTFDLPGFGASPAPEEAMGAEGYARVLAPAIAEVADRPLLVGHSFGGRVALALAAATPDRCAGLVLTGVPLLRIATAPQPSLGYRLARWANRRGLLADDAFERLRTRRGSADYRAASGVMRAVLVTAVNESYEELLRRLQVPVALIWGEDDREVPVEVARRAQQLLGGPVSLEIVAGAGHLLPLENTTALRAAVVKAMT
jgi:pimeloyl-ACP methyl ester carboxylesterase